MIYTEIDTQLCDVHNSHKRSEGQSMLSEALAQQIANEITDVIGFNVLITDAAGTVVGSGDERRIGQFHEASIEVIRARRMIAHSAADVRDLVAVCPASPFRSSSTVTWWAPSGCPVHPSRSNSSGWWSSGRPKS